MIGKKITELRHARGLTQQNVADGIGVSRATYAHYEIDRREPDNNTLIKIAGFFNVSTDYLLGLTNLPRPYELKADSPAYKLALETVEGVKKEGLTLNAIARENPELAEFMENIGIVQTKAKINLIEKSGLSLNTLEKVVALVKQIKKETTSGD